MPVVWHMARKRQGNLYGEEDGKRAHTQRARIYQHFHQFSIRLSFHVHNNVEYIAGTAFHFN